MTFHRIQRGLRAGKNSHSIHLAAIKPKLDQLRETLGQVMILVDPLEGIRRFSETMIQWQKHELVRDLIAYLNEEVPCANIDEQIMTLKVLQAHVELGNLDANEFSPEDARRFLTQYAGSVIVTVKELEDIVK